MRKKRPQRRAARSAVLLQSKSNCCSGNNDGDEHGPEKEVQESMQETVQQEAPQQEHNLGGANASTQSSLESIVKRRGRGPRKCLFTQSSRESTVKRRGRGPTKCLFGIAAKGITLPKIQFNERDQPIGPQSEKFSTYLGVVARKILGIKYKNWKEVPEALKKEVWSIINNDYQIDSSAEKWCIRAISQRLRSYRYRLYKQYYSIYPTDEERMANVPFGVNEYDWIEFVRMRSDPKFKEMAKVNKANRALEQDTHTSGRRGYFRVEHDLKQDCSLDDTKPVTRADVWMKCHVKKDGTPMSSSIAETIRRIKSTQSNASSLAYATKQDALAIVFGPEKKGLVRGVGFGVTRNELFGKEHAYKQEIREKDKELGKMKAAIDELMEWKATVKATMEGSTVVDNQNEGDNKTVGCSSPNPSQDSMKQSPLASGIVNGSIGTSKTQGQLLSPPSKAELEGKECFLTYFNGMVKVAKGYIRSTNSNFVMPTGEELGEGYYYVCPQLLLVDPDYEIKLKRRSNQCKYLADALNNFIAWKSIDIELINDNEEYQ